MFKLKFGLTALFLLPSCVELKGLTKMSNNNPTPFLLIIYDSHYDIIIPIHKKVTVKSFLGLMDCISINYQKLFFNASPNFLKSACPLLLLSLGLSFSSILRAPRLPLWCRSHLLSTLLYPSVLSMALGIQPMVERV